MIIFKAILFILASIYLSKAIAEEDFDSFFIAVAFYFISVNLEVI